MTHLLYQKKHLLYQKKHIEERTSEIRTFLKRHYGAVEIAFLEGYCKAKWASNHLEIGKTTEYFTFEDVEPVRAELEGAAMLTAYHRRRVRDALAEAAARGQKLGRPRQTESAERFLAKPKSQEIAKWLGQGLKLREIQRRTGYSMNTICKVVRLLKAAGNMEGSNDGTE